MQSAQSEAHAGPQYPQFKFVEFNPPRQLRGSEAARIEIIHSEGDHEFIWMSAGDIQANIRQFGKHEALADALDAYGQEERG